MTCAPAGIGITREHFVLVVHDDDLRVQIFLVLDDDRAHQAGRFVDVAFHRDARDHVAEFDLAGFVGENRDVVGIPLHEGFALLDLGAVGFGDDRADDDVVALEFAAFFVVHADRAVLVQHDPVAVERLDSAQIVELHRAIVLRLDDRLLEGLAGRAADVERPHRQLRAGLADRLRGDDADRFAELDELAGGKVAAVAHARRRRARFRRSAPNESSSSPRRHSSIAAAILFVDQLIRFNDLFLLVDGIDDRFAADAADDALAEIDDFFVAFVNRAHHDAVDRAAIQFVDDHVLRRIDELARQVTGVGSLERGIGQTFARAVSRNEILEHGQAFAEVRRDRPLDDFAGRLGHQTAHAGELTHLLAIAARAGIHHQEDRIQFLAALVVFEGAEHDVRNFVTGVRPDVDDLVVAFAVRDDAFAILLLDLS